MNNLFTMSVVELITNVSPNLFGMWVNEIHTKATELSENPVYFAFVGYDSTYLYFPTVNTLGVTYSDNIDPNATAVHFHPAIDASMTTFTEFANDSNACFSDTALEDITIGDVAEYIGTNVILYEHANREINIMYMFVNFATHEHDTNLMMSYINYALDVGGFVVNDNVNPIRYTMLEARSEMKRCNSKLYETYKRKVVTDMLRSAKEKPRSKYEMEYNVSGLAFELLFENVVSCLGVLWCFSNSAWHEYSGDGYIWNFLTTEFIEYLNGNGAEDIALHLMSTNARFTVMKDLKLRLQNDKFSGLLDSKKHIIRMTNGVYNTINETLSDPVPSDYISIVTGVPYQIFDKQSGEVRTLLDIFGSIFPNPDILEFFLLSCSTFLEGYNSPKVFYIWWGMGNNAKSLMQLLVTQTFGEYCSTAPTSLVTGKTTDSSGATPDLCHVDKKLVVFLQEPNPEEKIKVGRMKEMTGNDTMYVRQLFKQGKTMTIKAKIVIVCNNIIEIPGMDAAIRRRILVIPFTSTFYTPDEYSERKTKGTLEPNSNIINLSVEKKLLNCKKAFMYLLCRRFSQWKNNENMLLNVPSVIKEITDEYITKHNYPLRFINTFMENVDNSSIAATELYELFKEWFRKSYPNKKLQNSEQFAKEVFNEGYKEDKNGIINNTYVSYTGDN